MMFGILIGIGITNYLLACILNEIGRKNKNL